MYTSGAGTAPAGDSSDCIAPRLRMRIRQINVPTIGVWPGELDMYCVVQATDGASSEVVITPLQRGLRDGSTLVFSPTASIFWGQSELHATTNNLTITYQCFRSTNASSYTSVLGALSDAANRAGGSAGEWGWVFGAGSVAASVAGAAIAAASADQLRLSVQQTIDASALYDLTNGRTWRVAQQGTAGGVDGRWNWSLEIEAWGCSDVRMRPQ